MRVIVVDDHKMMREGLRALLEKAEVDVVGEASDGHQAVAETKRLHPDVVVMDVAMPKLNGIDATRRITAEMPQVKVIGLSMNTDRRYVLAMLEAGAAGYMLKSGTSEELRAALDVVTSGQKYLSPAIASSVVDEALGPKSRPCSDRPPSMREREVLQLIAEGKSSKEIATILKIAVPTVETHRRQLMNKVKLRTVAELTKYAIREGLTSADK
jgi:DNA-binding NarL/FixJ family response regulator